MKRTIYNFCFSYIICCISFFAEPRMLFSQVNSLFYLEVTNTAGDDIDVNNNRSGDNTFNQIRGKLFLNSWLSDEIAVFTKILYDDGIRGESGGKVRIDGAYFLFDLNQHIKGKIGRIPISVGNFPTRSYLEQNPLIGSPLIYQYRTSLYYTKITDIDQTLTNRGQRRGVAFLYESCWDDGAELFGSHTIIDYSFAVTQSSVFNPRASSQDGKQIISRIGLRPVMGMRLGVGYAHAPYANGEIDTYTISTNGSPDVVTLPLGRDINDYTGEIIVADFEYTAGHVQIYSEWVRTWFKAGPNLDELTAAGYYIEAQYTLTPQLFAAGRFGQMIFDEVETSTGTMEPWDYNVSRIELGLGYKLTRSMVVKGVSQFNTYDDAPLEDIQFVALQLKAFF